MKGSLCLVIATGNPDKLREINAVLAGSHLNLLSMGDFPDFPEIEEDGSTLEENAIKKARGINIYTGYPALADDTGLEVAALNGKPGVFSARYAGESATYDDNVKKLLSELKNIPDSDRNARFRTVMVLADGDKIFSVEGNLEGKILFEARGNGGFGYDPVFYVPEYDQTFAEMSLELKNRISHRGKALSKMKDTLISYYKEVCFENQ